MLPDEISNRLSALRVKLEVDQIKLFKLVVKCERSRELLEISKAEILLELFEELDGQKTNAEQREAMLVMKLAKDRDHQELLTISKGERAEIEVLKIEIEQTKHERNDIKSYVALVTAEA
jgi:hypothetical protein